MIPKFRAWIKKEKCFADGVKAVFPTLCEVGLYWKAMLEMIEWIDNEIRINKKIMKERKITPVIKDSILADNRMLAKIKEELLKREASNE